MRLFLNSRWKYVCLTAILLPLLLLAADSKFEEKSETTLLAEYYLSATVHDLSELTLTFDEQQADWLPIVPPSSDFVLRQDSDFIVFDPKGFPESFTQRLVPEPFDTGWIYPVLVMEDSVTRDRLFFNSNHELIARVPAPFDYNPWWLLEERYPDINNGTYTYDRFMSLRILHDPARIVLRFPLIERNTLLKYVAKRSFEKTDKTKEKSVPIVMKAYEGPPLTNIQFTCTEVVSNGIRLTIAYPWNGATWPANSFTNRIEIFHSTNLLGFWWTTGGVVNVSSTTNWIEWTDTTTGESNATVRFYAAGNGDLDSDSDLLTDAQEKFMYHSSPTNSDTDGDSISDYTEVISLNTDPCNSDTNKPVAAIIAPTNGMNWVWMP